MERDVFCAYHPLVNFLYFAMVLVFAMCWMDPVSLAVALGSSLGYCLYLKGAGALGRQVRAMLPLAGMVAVINPLFNHAGDTVLAHFPSGAPLTLESVAYGLAAAVMLWAVMSWFTCYTAVMSADKFVYLFGRAAPTLSLILSMTLGLIPKLKRRFAEVAQAQKSVGLDVGAGPLLRRLRVAVTIVSILITWSLENAMETADSMRSRGYGLPGRTAFSIYFFTRRDKLVLGWLAACGAVLVWGWARGGFAWQYFPTLQVLNLGPGELALRGCYLALCLTPLILNGREELVWRRLRCAM